MFLRSAPWISASNMNIFTLNMVADEFLFAALDVYQVLH